jgi:hypothetical protein
MSIVSVPLHRCEREYLKGKLFAVRATDKKLAKENGNVKRRWVIEK